MSYDVKYIGMDVHKEATVIAVLNESGKLVMESVIETKASSILQFLHRLRGELHVTWEEGTWAAWLYDLLQPQVQHIVGFPEVSMRKPSKLRVVLFIENHCSRNQPCVRRESPIQSVRIVPRSPALLFVLQPEKTVCRLNHALGYGWLFERH